MQDNLSYEHELKKILIYMGITPNYRGYEYILFAMKLIFKKPVYLRSVTKELYPEIAKECLTDAEDTVSVSAFVQQRNKIKYEALNFIFKTMIHRVMGKPRYSPRGTRSATSVIFVQASMMA